MYCCINFRHRSSTTCIRMISYVLFIWDVIKWWFVLLCMNWVIPGFYVEIWYYGCGLIYWNYILLEMMFKWKVFYIVLISQGLLWESVTLCLPIPLVPVTCPWIRVVTKLVSEHWLNSCIFGYNGLFPVTVAVIRFHHVFDKSSLL